MSGVGTYNDTVLSNTDIGSNGGSFNDTAFADCHMFTDLHRVVAEYPNGTKASVVRDHGQTVFIDLPFICLVRRSYDGPLREQTVPSNGNDHGMATSRSAQVPSNHTVRLYNGLCGYKTIGVRIHVRKEVSPLPCPQE